MIIEICDFRSLSGAGGGDRIRTCGDFRHDGFQDRYLQPLGHPSECHLKLADIFVQPNIMPHTEANVKSR